MRNAAVVLTSWLIAGGFMWAIVRLGGGEPKSPCSRHHWRVPFVLTRTERECNRIRYGGVA
jgi:hypothetical protein